jgi:hypothetical protein
MLAPVEKFVYIHEVTYRKVLYIHELSVERAMYLWKIPQEEECTDELQHGLII